MDYKFFLTLLVTSVITSYAQTHASANIPSVPTDKIISTLNYYNPHTNSDEGPHTAGRQRRTVPPTTARRVHRGS